MSTLIIGIFIAFLVWLVIYFIRRTADLNNLYALIKNDGGMSNRYKGCMTSLTNGNYDITVEQKDNLTFKFRVNSGATTYLIKIHEVIGLVHIDYEMHIPMVPPVVGHLLKSHKNPPVILEAEQVKLAEDIGKSLLASSRANFDNIAQSLL